MSQFIRFEALLIVVHDMYLGKLEQHYFRIRFASTGKPIFKQLTNIMYALAWFFSFYKSIWMHELLVRSVFITRYKLTRNASSYFITVRFGTTWKFLQRMKKFPNSEFHFWAALNFIFFLLVDTVPTYLFSNNFSTQKNRVTFSNRWNKLHNIVLYELL